jgi:hypothetical protein
VRSTRSRTTRQPALRDARAAAGVETVTNDVPAAGMRQLFFSDPNGVRIELNVT